MQLCCFSLQLMAGPGTVAVFLHYCSLQRAGGMGSLTKSEGVWAGRLGRVFYLCFGP